MNENDPKVDLGPEESSDSAETLVSRLSGRTAASGRYHLKGEVARGGMGIVLRVWDEDLRRHLAMKVLLGQSEGRSDTPPVDKRQLARFLEEAQVTSQLDHPGIVPVHELGLDSQRRVFFTMKLVKGRTLAEVFDELREGRGGWTQMRVLGLVLRVCEAMSYAHAKGVVHRDLKPSNVMIGKFGEVLVMDWGLAKILGREDTRDLRLRPAEATSEVVSDRREDASATPDASLCTMDGDVVGTPAYMSPEQAAGDLARIGPHSDVYAVGAMLYHLLAGHMPYVPRGARLNNYAVWQRVQEGPPRALQELAPQAPAELAAIVEKAMARKIASRYSDMQLLATDLSAFVEGRVVRAYETGALAEARKWVRRNRLLAMSSLAGFTVLVAGLVATVVLQGRANRAIEQAYEEEKLTRVLVGLIDSADPTRYGEATSGQAGFEDLRALVEDRSVRERLLRKMDHVVLRMMWAPITVPFRGRRIVQSRIGLGPQVSPDVTGYAEEVSGDGNGGVAIEVRELLPERGDRGPEDEFTLLQLRTRARFLLRYRDFSVLDWNLFLTNYATRRRAGTVTISGRECATVEVERKQAPERRYVVAVDRETGLVLESIELSLDGETLSTARFSTVDFPATVDLPNEERLPARAGKTRAAHVPHCLEALGYRELERTQVQESGGAWFDKILLSDGVETIAILVGETSAGTGADAGVVNIRDMGNGWSEWSGGSPVRNARVTVVGKLSPETIREAFREIWNDDTWWDL